MEDSRKKFDMLEGKTAICPLCETSIRPSVRKSLQDNYRSDGHQSREIFNKNKQEKERVDILQKSLSENVKKEEAEYSHKKKLLEQNLTSLESDAFIIQARNIGKSAFIIELQSRRTRKYKVDTKKTVTLF